MEKKTSNTVKKVATATGAGIATGVAAYALISYLQLRKYKKSGEELIDYVDENDRYIDADEKEEKGRSYIKIMKKTQPRSYTNLTNIWNKNNKE